MGLVVVTANAAADFAHPCVPFSLCHSYSRFGQSEPVQTQPQRLQFICRPHDVVRCVYVFVYITRKIEACITKETQRRFVWFLFCLVSAVIRFCSYFLTLFSFVAAAVVSSHSLCAAFIYIRTALPHLYTRYVYHFCKRLLPAISCACVYFGCVHVNS